MTTILQLLLVLGLMVLVHEFGHFIVAKWCGVRIETFAIGFGKRVVGFRRGGTDYQINMLPLGGYVKMAGEIPGEDVSKDPGELNNHPRWQRMLIALAGPVANFMLALALMTGAFMFHHEVNENFSGPAVIDYISPTTIAAKTGIHSGDTIVRFDNIEKPDWADILNRTNLKLNQTVPFSFAHDGQISDTALFLAFKGNSSKFSLESAFAMGLVPKMQNEPIKVETPTPGGPSDRAGLKPGDQIVSVNGISIYSTPALLAYLQDEKGKAVMLSLLRDGQLTTLPVQPEMSPSGDGTQAYHLGFRAFDSPARVEQLPFSKAASASWDFNKKSSVQIVNVLQGIFQRQISVKLLSGPIGMGQMVHDAAEAGWMPLVGTMAMISINLGMFNLLPFPILDGGMIFLLLIESAFRKDLPMPIKERIYQVAFVCILLFAAMVIFNDITKLPFFIKMKS